MKTIKELKEGSCTVVAEFNGTIKEFEGSYNDKFKVVFMTIPQRYNIIGYIQ